MKEKRNSVELTRELAWRAARGANWAYDELSDVEARQALLRMAAKRQLGGVALLDAEAELEPVREQAAINYAYLCSVASEGIKIQEEYFSQVVTIVFHEEGEPQPVNPSLYAHLIHVDEIKAYLDTVAAPQKGLHTRFINKLLEISEEVTVETLDDYNPNSSDQYQIRALRLVPEKRPSWFDRANIKQVMQAWSDGEVGYPFTRGIAFERMLRDLMELPPRPAVKSPETEKEMLARMTGEHLLMDELIMHEGEEIKLITPRSLERFGLSRGYSHEQLQPLKEVIARIASFILPSDATYQKLPHRFSRETTLVKTYEDTDNNKVVELWGLDPQFFVEIITLANKSITIRERIGGYPKKNKNFLIEYVQALSEVIEKNENTT